MRPGRATAGAAALLTALWLAACASGGSGRSGTSSRSDHGEYYGGSIHRNSFPETFGSGGGPGRIGRPDRYRF